MSQLENFAREAQQIESEIARALIALDIDPDDATRLRLLARDALSCGSHCNERGMHDPQVAARVELFGLAQLMLTVMRESAQERQIETHGGRYWKAFARALWAEHEADKGGASHPGSSAPSEV